MADAHSELLEKLPVDLVFEVGRLEISAKELTTLRTGFTFLLDRSPTTPVTIRANGRVIGRGELVQVDDRLGVTLKEIGNGRES